MELTQEQIEVSHLLDMTEKGKAKSSITNAELILSHDPVLKGAIRFNELTQRVEIGRAHV